jgi:hypothetical protein
MPDFQLPVGTDQALDSLELLNVSFDIDVKPADERVVRSFLAGRANVHVKHRHRAALGTRDGELSAILGVHEDARRGLPNDLFLHGHVRFERRTPRPAIRVSDAEWRAVVDLLHGLMGARPAEVNLRLNLPQDTVAALQLPIDLRRSEVAGFSEIRGVQLAQLDAEDADRVLYSAILQRTPSGLAVDVQTPAAIVLDHNALVEAFQRAMSVARLAVPSMEPV